MKMLTYAPQSVYLHDAELKDARTSLLSRRIRINVLPESGAERNKKKTMTLFAIPVRKFRAYKEQARSENRHFAIVGQTKLHQVEEDALYDGSGISKADAALVVSNKHGITSYFEVRDKHRFSRVVGYLPVGNDQFVAVVSFNPIYLGILLVLLCGLVLSAYFATLPPKENLVDNRYIEEVEISEVHSDENSTRYRLNTTLTISRNTIQNLNFENVNEDRYLRLKIKLDYENDTEYIYDSNLVPFGKRITADTLLKEVPAGTYHTIAECYSYSLEKKQLAQTNFEITLIVK